jgi:hypothetical protein
MPLQTEVARLRQITDAVRPPPAGGTEDYRISAELGAALLGRGRSGRVALLVPIASAAGAVGRSGGGFTLSSSAKVVFEHHGRRWEQPSAILECTDVSVEDAFLVLVSDIAARLGSRASDVTWRDVLASVEEWQALLGRRSLLTSEEQLGLWGELWVIQRASYPDQLVAAWRGPSRDPVDFFCDGMGVEIKTSRRSHVHHVAQSQVDDPSGDNESYLLSLWVGSDPVRGSSLGQIVADILGRLDDPAAFLRKLGAAGYSPQDQQEYSEKYVTLEPASWFHIRDVPRVRAVDDGVYDLRYTVALDMGRRIDDAHALGLWSRLGCAKSDAES